MKEDFLHYIWKFQKFNVPNPTTTDGKGITVFSVGNHNQNSGPDFEEAKIKMGNIEWVGQVEAHIHSSDWKKHQHQKDPSYQNVILHVVWDHDEEIFINDEKIPTIELKNKVDAKLVSKYQSIQNHQRDILCADQLSTVSPIIFNNMLDKALVERLQAKAHEVAFLLKGQVNDWEEITYLTLVKNFGLFVNKESFVQLAQSAPHHLLHKYHHQITKMEALLFGQAGFLEETVDPYQTELKGEYEFLKGKHQLKPQLTRSSWKFARMRPANFPTVRLAQLAGLIHSKPKLFDFAIHQEHPNELLKALKMPIGKYWRTHYDFGKKRSKPAGNIGRSTLENVVINTISPLLAAYSSYIGNTKYLDKALAFLELSKPEKNKIIKQWGLIGKQPNHAFDTQGMIAIYKNYCLKKRCLQCNVGAELMER